MSVLIQKVPVAKRKPSGFTLSELLIAISVLGIIASLTIPKVLQSVETTQNKAKFKEVIGSLSAVMAQGLQEGSLYPNMGDANFTNYIASKLVFKKYCNTNATTQGCSAG